MLDFNTSLFSRLYPVGRLNAITDVEDVRVGHITLVEGTDIRTGATAILPHGGNLFQDRVPAGFCAFNGFGKITGTTQIEELGEIETPILLTNTLATGRGIEALIHWTLAQEGNSHLTSINAVVGETNDSRLNQIRTARPDVNEMMQALQNASQGAVTEGGVGAGTGTVTFGYKGGIGTSSRMVTILDQTWTLGILVQSNFGGHLHIRQAPCSNMAHDKDGSIVIILATDAPLSSRQLKRLANRAIGGLARTGAALSHGSGDYALAFSTAKDVRHTAERRAKITMMPAFPEESLSPLFEAAIEATEESILRSMLMAETTQGLNAKTMKPSTFPALTV